MTDASSHRVGYEVSTELYGEFGGRISGDVIRGCVRAAMTDLHGSISREALPEMAVRLARVRLAALAQAGHLQHSRVRWLPPGGRVSP
jgi:hypothetical protein